MCVASAVTDYFRDKWVIKPNDPNNNWTTLPYIPYEPSPAGRWITEEQWKEYQDLKRIANEYDQRTGQPHCQKDTEAWEAVIIKVLKDKGLLHDDDYLKVGGIE